MCALTLGKSAAPLLDSRQTASRHSVRGSRTGTSVAVPIGVAATFDDRSVSPGETEGMAVSEVAQAAHQMWDGDCSARETLLRSTRGADAHQRQACV